MNALAAWWAGLQGRERVLVGIGALALLATLYYLAVFEPLAQRETRLVKSLDGEFDTQLWLNAQRAQLGAPGAAAPRERLPDGASLLAAINQSAAASGVSGQLARVTPAGVRGATLSFAAVAYADFMRWLLAVDQQYGASVERIRLEKTEAPGIVNVELSLAF